MPYRIEFEAANSHLRVAVEDQAGSVPNALDGLHMPRPKHCRVEWQHLLRVCIPSVVADLIWETLLVHPVPFGSYEVLWFELKVDQKLDCSS